MNLDFLQELLIISIALSVITCAFIQKTKIHFKCSKCLPVYSFVVNMSIGIIFCITFTDINFPTSLWVGLFSFLGADSLYKALEGKLSSYTELINRNKVTIPTENIINREEIDDGKTDISE